MADSSNGKSKPYGDVKYADPKNGKYPIDTEAHIRAAWSYINQAKNASAYPLNGVTLGEVKARIKAAMHGLGAETDGDSASSSSSASSRGVYARLYAVEDMHIIRSADGGDGRTVEAFAAVFDQPAEIEDWQGHYLETIDRSAFNRAIDHAQRARGGLAGSIKVLWNHGRDLGGKPSDRFSMPIGVPVEIRAEARGLLTRTHYSATPLADEVLENIRSGAITAQSFVGPIIRSNPQLMRGDRYRPRGHELQTVTRTELGLRDYGPVLYPAYSGAEILGVRMSIPGQWSDDPGDGDDDFGTAPHDAPAAGDPPASRQDDELDGHSARYHQHELFKIETEKALAELGLEL